MSQHDLTIDNASGSAVRADLNLALQALGSTSIGSSAPSTLQTGQLWIDNSGTPWVVKVYDGAQHITIGSVNASTNTFNLAIAEGGTGATTLAGANILVKSATSVLTAGFSATPDNAGTKSSGTYTPDEADGNLAYAVNGGAHTLAPPTNNCTLVIQYTNNSSAGTVTTSGFTQVTGDDITTTNGHDFFFQYYKG